MKNKKISQSEQFQNKISKSLKEAKSISQRHKYIIAYFPGSVLALQ
jgi:hypothetical protein